MAENEIQKWAIKPISELLSGLSSIVAAFIIMFYYLIFLTASVVTLGAHQLQYSIQALDISGRHLSLSEISSLQANIEEIDSNIFDVRFDIRDLENQLKNAEAIEKKSEINKSIEIKRSDIANYEDNKKRLLAKYDENTQAVIEDFMAKRKFLSNFEGFTTRPLSNRSIYLPSFTEMPPELLTLLLIMFMGALGGTIHLTKLFLDRFRGKSDSSLGTIRNASYYVFRPILGAVVAFCVYVLVKAGVLVVSLPTTPDVGAQLNPFFVSFLGIISGLLAEEALGTIRRAGTAWFRGSASEVSKRWAHENLVKLEIDDHTKTGLSNHLGISKEKLESWLTGREGVPWDQQRTIAAWLREPVRNLFSDIEPVRNSDAAARQDS